MKTFILSALLTVGTALSCFAVEEKPLTYTEEMQFLGAVAGQGLACKAEKYDSYELLARAILISKAKSDAQQAEGMKVYNNYKASAFINTIEGSSQSCSQINDIFNHQKIFKSTLYSDGTIKMPDGTIITPRHPYDATQVYQKDPQAREKFIAQYRRQKEKILNDPKYQRALRDAKTKYGM